MNRQQVIESVVEDQLKDEKDIGNFSVGDTLNVHVRIIEGNKERVQIYQGVLISMNGRGINRTITVRRIVANEGVERVFPVHSPRIAQIEVVRRGDVRRAKLYYLRDRVGKSRRLRDQRRGLKHALTTAEPSKASAEGRDQATKETAETAEATSDN